MVIILAVPIFRIFTVLQYLFGYKTGVTTFSSAGKFCLAHRLRQLTQKVKSDVRTLNFRSNVTHAPQQKKLFDVRRRSLCDIKCQK